MWGQAKFVPVSIQRVLSVDASSPSDVRVTVWGDAGEEVEFAFADAKSGKVSYVRCTFPSYSTPAPAVAAHATATASRAASSSGVTMVVSSAAGACS